MSSLCCCRGLLLLLLLLVLVLGVAAAGGCTKRIALVAGEADVSDGRRMEVQFADGSILTGRIVRGAPVQFTRNDSLFSAEIDDIGDGVIELSRQQLLTSLAEWSELTRVAERTERVAERADLGGTLLLEDDITRVTLLETDRRRMVTESLFWGAAVLTAGYAASR